jgi:hypothetical protein
MWLNFWEVGRWSNFINTPELHKITHVPLKVCQCVTEDDFGSFGSMPVTQGNDY